MRENAYRSNGKHREALAADHALVMRDRRAVIIPLDEATSYERAVGIASIEALAISIVERAQRRHGFMLTAEQRGDAVAHLITCAWHEAQRFDGRGRLGGFVTSRLRWRMVDWLKAEIGHPSNIEIVPLQHAPEAAVELTVESRPLWQVLGVDLDALSMPARFALVSLAEPLSRGESLSSVAAACEVSRHAARDMMAQLADELRALGVEP